MPKWSQIGDISFYFPQRTGLTFHANCIGDNLHELSNPVFSVKKKKNKKNTLKCRLLKIPISKERFLNI